MSEKVAIFDFDGVFTDKSSAVEFIKYLTREGFFDIKCMNNIEKVLEKYFTGEKSYQETSEAIGREWLEGIEGKKKDEIQQKAKEFVKEFEYDEKGEKVIEHFNSKGYSTILMSSSPIEIIGIIADDLGFDKVVATVTNVKDGRYVKENDISIIGEDSKVEYIQSNLKEADFGNSYGFGDTVHDLGFLELVGNPAVINPGREMKEKLERREWESYPDLGTYLEVLEE